MHARDRGGQGTLRRLAGNGASRHPRERACPSAKGERWGGNANLPPRAARNRWQTGLKGAGPVRLRWFIRPILPACPERERQVVGCRKFLQGPGRGWIC
jgi:hypothetical protein